MFPHPLGLGNGNMKPKKNEHKKNRLRAKTAQQAASNQPNLKSVLPDYFIFSIALL